MLIVEEGTVQLYSTLLTVTVIGPCRVRERAETVVSVTRGRGACVRATCLPRPHEPTTQAGAHDRDLGGRGCMGRVVAFG